jgi:hypothetical protein
MKKKYQLCDPTQVIEKVQTSHTRIFPTLYFTALCLRFLSHIFV